jgi:hypothetical protein
VDRSRNIKEDQRMTIRGETSDVDVARGICLIQLCILILKLSTMVRHLKEQTLHNFKQVAEEEGHVKFMLKQISKKKIEWTH